MVWRIWWGLKKPKQIFLKNLIYFLPWDFLEGVSSLRFFQGSFSLSTSKFYFTVWIKIFFEWSAINLNWSWICKGHWSASLKSLAMHKDTWLICLWIESRAGVSPWGVPTSGVLGLCLLLWCLGFAYPCGMWNFSVDCTWLANEQDTFHGHGERMHCALCVLQCIVNVLLKQYTTYLETFCTVKSQNFVSAMLHLHKNILGIRIGLCILQGDADENRF